MVELSELERVLLHEEEPRARVQKLFELNKVLGNTDFIRSLMICREAVELSEKLGDNALLAKALVNLGNVQWKSGDNVAAQENYLKSLELYRELDDHRGLSNAYCGLGIVHGNLNDSANALEFFEKGVAEAQKAGDEVMIAHNLGNVGHIYANIGDHVTALKYFAKALAIDRELGELGKQGVSNMLGAIAGVLVFQGEYEGAIERLEESLVIDEEISNSRGTATTLMNLGITYRKAGRFADSIAYLNRALAYVEKVHYGAILPLLHQQFAETYEAIGDTEEAMRHMRIHNDYEMAEKRMRLQQKARQII